MATPTGNTLDQGCGTMDVDGGTERSQHRRVLGMCSLRAEWSGVTRQINSGEVPVGAEGGCSCTTSWIPGGPAGREES